MLPLIFLALGLGVALTAYERSPRARERIDDYARVIREAHEAHRAADAHLYNARRAADVAARHARASQDARQLPPAPASFAPPAPSPPAPSPVPAPAPTPDQADQPAPPVPTAPVAPPSPTPVAPASAPPAQVIPPPSPVADAHAGAAQVASDAAENHAAIAAIAHDDAAQSTAEAARLARTEAERRAAAESAARVVAREQKIAEAFATLGVGQCDVRTYSRVTTQAKDALLSRLHAEGMTVTGDNPWSIDTSTVADVEMHDAGVKLRAAWNPKTQALKLIVTTSAWYVPCAAIWKRIDPKIKGILGS